ncbi:hypothetical protein HOD88_01110 [archaeon]|jgi:hypothetical protein|nr:hypothetical protein [archaeon]
MATVEVKILTLGQNQDYLEVDTTSQGIQKAFQEANREVDGPLADMVISSLTKDSGISADQLTPYGGTIPLGENYSRGDTILQSLEIYFGELSKYAVEHGARHVVVQKLQMDPRNKKVEGLTQLLVKSPQQFFKNNLELFF